MKKTFTHKVHLLILMLFLANSMVAQDYLSTLSDNYMGINQALLQPASIVDSRLVEKHHHRDELGVDAVPHPVAIILMP